MCVETSDLRASVLVGAISMLFSMGGLVAVRRSDIKGGTLQ